MTYPSGKTVSYTYDDMDRLTAVKGLDGAKTKYAYDALGRRTDSTAKPRNETTSYIWDITRGDGMLLSETTNGSTTKYDYGLERISALNGSRKTEYLYDGRGSVAAELSYSSAWYTLGGALSKADVTGKTYSPIW